MGRSDGTTHGSATPDGDATHPEPTGIASTAEAPEGGEAVPSSPTHYPAQWEGDVVTADGGTVHVRPIRPGDGPLIEAFHSRQSAESIYYRYFSPRPRLSAKDLEHLTTVDYRDRMAFVALLGDEMVAVARYDRWRDRDEAEVAFFVDDAQHGRGLATILLEHLAAAGREAGILTFVAHVLPANRKMISVFRQAGFRAVSRFTDGVIEVRFDIEPTPEAEAAIEARARLADVRSVARLVAPSTVAVVGAGRTRGTIGHETFRRLLEHEFNGPVYPVNPEARHVSSVRAYPSVIDVPDRIDLAIVAVPAPEVPAVVEECARARVGAVVVISAGFAEAGPEGREAQRALVSMARRHGVRLLGPNSLGIINTAPDVNLVATFAPVLPVPGRVALSSQSGTLGAAIAEQAHARGLGLSTMVSVGNMADVSANDLLRYWESDEATDVVLLYLESFGNPLHFGRIATEVSRAKPIVAVKAGRDPVADALLGQTGVVRVDNLDQLLDVARVLAHQPVPPGDRVAVVGNSAGPAHVAVDACRGAGLEPAVLAPETVAALEALDLPGSAVSHPVDLTHRAGPEHYRAALHAVLADPGVDQVLVVYAPPVALGSDEVVAAIEAASEAAPAKPVVASVFDGTTRATLGTVPNFTFPDVAAHALGRAAAYGRWRAQPVGEEPSFPDEGRLDDVRRRIEAVLPADGARRWLDADDVVAVLCRVGIDLLDVRLVASPEEAAAAAAEVGFPVALKAANRSRRAKSEAGGIALDLHSGSDVARAYQRMAERFGDGMRPAALQAMAPPGYDVRVRVTQDPVVGMALAVGPGGVAARDLPDVAVQVLPLTDVTARRLAGALGLDDGASAAHLEQLLLRLAWLVDEVPELVHVDLDPVIVSPTGAGVADAKVGVARVPVATSPAVRRL